MKNTKILKTDRSLEQNTNKINQLENELKEAQAKIKDLESNKEREEKSEKKVRFGADVAKKETEALKAKQDELDKLKLNFSKVNKFKS